MTISAAAAKKAAGFIPTGGVARGADLVATQLLSR
jgi:hypothetical protein